MSRYRALRLAVAVLWFSAVAQLGCGRWHNVSGSADELRQHDDFERPRDSTIGERFGASSKAREIERSLGVR